MNFEKNIFAFFVTFLALNCFIFAQSAKKIDTAQKAKDLLENASVKSEKKEIELTIRNVDIGKFPEINIICEAFNLKGEPLDSLEADKLTVLENGSVKKVLSVKKISNSERVPVDFVFIIDITGSMQKYINAVMSNISSFTNNLVKRGIDYRLGLVLFSDIVDKEYSPTDNVSEFMGWLGQVRASGGIDEKENALEAIDRAFNMKFRPSANRVAVIITDAPYHQIGDKGQGVTYYSTETIIDELKRTEVRLFPIVPTKLKDYQVIAKKTRGQFFDIEYPFSTILDRFSTQLTNLFAIKYRSDQAAIPDSINVAILNEKKQELVRKIIPIVEIGRKLIIENLLYETNSYTLSDSIAELEVLREFMKNKPSVIIKVEGHADSKGLAWKNQALSLKRAESVKQYLIRKGVDPKRIQTVGYGSEKPIADNSTEFGRKLNRRTEIVIIAK